MSRNAWIVIIGAAVAFVLYTVWKQTQTAPRVPVTSVGGGGDGLIDGVSRTVSKLSALFGGLGGTSSSSSSSTITTEAKSGIGHYV